MRRIGIFFLLLTVFCLLLTSCDMLGEWGITLPWDTPEETTTAEATTTAPITTTVPRAALAIPYATLADYKVIVTDGSEDEAATAASLAAAIGEKAGVTLAVADELGFDSDLQIAVVDPDELGLNGMKYLDYSILYIENTVYITAGSTEARSAAIAKLLGYMQAGKLIVPASGYDYIHEYPVAELLLNGADISRYGLLADGENRAYVERLRDGILEKTGILLPITESASGPSISLSVNRDGNAAKTTVTADGDEITIRAGGKNATYFGVSAFLDMLTAATENGRINMTIDNTVLDNQKYAAPSAGAFYNAAGELDRDGNGEIHIVFIGGSLTQNNQVWCPPVVAYFQKMFPNKTVTYTNAAIGATDSTMGAIRFAHDVLDVVSPDIVFVEYAVNDAGFGTENDYARRKNGVYIESIIRQCLAHENQPAVALLYFPRGFEPGSTAWTNWENGVALKERIAENYGIKSVNVLDYVKALYEGQKAKNPALTYADFLLQYYNPSDMVHPTDVGYGVFRDAILAALEADFEGFLTNRVDADFCLADYEREIMTTWELVPLDDSRIALSGDFIHYESIPSYPSSDPRHIPSGNLAYPRFVDGIWQIESKTDFKIEITAKANIVGFYGLYSTKADGMAVDIVNKSTNAVLGTATIAAPGSEHGRPYLATVTVSDEAKRATYVITQGAGDNGTVFRAGYIILGTYAE